MSNVGLIVRREIGAYLRTPGGYVIMASILMVNGLIFNALAVTGRRLSAEVLATFLLNAGAMTIIAGVLLSMRLLAEERSTGTQVLLFTSPIREGEIVLGKFLASLAFLVLLVLASLYLPALIFVNGKVSYGHIAAGYLGMLMLGATTLAIGTFASSLVKHPFFAVILTAVFVGVLELLGYVGPDVEGTLGTVITFAAPHMSHFRPSSVIGLIRLNDVVYFATIIYLSLLAATQVLKSQRWQ